MRPSSYDEDEDKGGGILTEEELNNGRPGTGSDAAKGGEEVPEGVLTCTLKELPGMIDKVVNEDKKTPLILDPSEEGKVKTSLTSTGWPMPPRYLFRSRKVE